MASMSLELRTPMNAVIGMAGLLSSTPLSTQQQLFVPGIRQGGEVLLFYRWVGASEQHLRNFPFFTSYSPQLC